MIHDVLDLEHWMSACSIDDWRGEGLRADGRLVVGPEDVVLIESLRREAEQVYDLGRRVTSDVFVFARGEAPDRAVTKIGGLPYLRRDRPWPVSSQGLPLTFIGQLCFKDSLDLVPALPGDILLVFGEKHIRAATLEFRWETILETNALAREVPETGWFIPPCYGTIHRSFDLPGAQNCFPDSRQPWRLCVFEGTKIGGVPRWIQEEEHLPGQFLCTIGSVVPMKGRRFAFANTPQPMPAGERHFSWGDSGILYLFLSDDGRVHWTVQNY